MSNNVRSTKIEIISINTLLCVIGYHRLIKLLMVNWIVLFILVERYKAKVLYRLLSLIFNTILLRDNQIKIDNVTG